MASNRPRFRPIHFIASLLPLVTGVGCASQSSRASAPFAPSATFAVSSGDVAGRLALIARVRHTPPIRPVPVTPVDDATFDAALAEEEKATAEARAGFEGAGSHDYTSKELATQKSARDVVKAEVLGFYSTAGHAVFVRRRSATTSFGADAILDHELEHAAQEQRFGPPLAELGPNMDAVLARMAVFEGDAMLTQLLVSAARAGSRLGPALAAASHFSAQMEGLVHSHSRPTTPLALQQVRWKYGHGAEFASDLVRIGGFALLDDALSHPPASTSQVIHLEKFLAGQMPTKVDSPPTLPGWDLIETGTFGELGTALFLEYCLDPDTAERAAEGWAGDAYSDLGKGPFSAKLAVWVWDDQAAATRFASTLNDFARCVKDEKGVHVLQSGTRVALKVGSPLAVADLSKLFPLVREKPKNEPRGGAFTLPSSLPRESDYFGDARATPTTFTLPGIGITTPRLGLEAKVSRVLALLATGPGVAVSASMSWNRRTPEFEDSMTRATFKPLGVGANPEVLSGVVATGAGPADRRSVLLPNGGAMDLLFTSVCHGEATLFLSTTWVGRETGGRTARAWLDGVRVDGVDDSPSCAALKSLPEPELSAHPSP